MVHEHDSQFNKMVGSTKEELDYCIASLSMQQDTRYSHWLFINKTGGVQRNDLLTASSAFQEVSQCVGCVRVCET